MARKSSWRAVALVVTLVFALAACSHRVSINSNPPGARAFVDDQFIGVTPASFVEKSGMRKEYRVRLEKDGYRTLTTRERQRVNLTYLLFLPFTCFLGIFWAFTLEDRYDYSLVRA